ncbi:PROTEIN D2013.6 [Ceraceosorus bombacis]|uniref:PROTEIN D2013.6 n=1 Tax=Ceraceosorus bombacis TaxID=401625 RepID=A0A0N7L900_9BASI|nr:PROTEIN D2013.6 [Ceraceosorus bombacis]
MALNWTMVDEDGRRPVPLPHEKVFYSVEHCQISLQSSTFNKKLESKGTAFCTNQRVLFLEQPFAGQPSASHQDTSTTPTQLHSLSVPLNNWQDARYMIPIFGQAYYEARILAVRGGGLWDESTNDSSARMSLVKIWFNEGGGSFFKDAVEEAKNRLEQGAASAHFEALPTYSPPPPGSSVNAAASISAPATSAQTATPSTALTTHITSASEARSTDSMPGQADLAAAAAAREAEEEEEVQRERRASVIQAAPGANELDPRAPQANPDSGEHGDLPGYDEATSSARRR